MTVRSRYDDAIAAGVVTADSAQLSAVVLLDDILLAVNAPPKRRLFRNRPEPLPGAYLWGGVGVGKSMLMDMLYEEVVAAKERWHFHAFMQWVHSELNIARKSGADDAIAPVVRSLAGRIRFLAFDEMQIKDIADAMIVGRLFEGMLNAGISIVTTSNRPPDDLYKNEINRHLFEPFIDLIKERLTVHQLVGSNDYRQGRSVGVKRYFTPANAWARAELQRIWDKRTKGQAGPKTIKVQGRSVVLKEVYDRAARASFSDLCSAALGAADYLAIAKEVDEIFITDIPRLSRDNFNEAKRFVTLIDALYEAKVVLFASAADEPERLYVEGAGRFEFDRSSSRLREMQSDGWGQQ